MLAVVLPGMVVAEPVARLADMAPGLAGVVAHQLWQVVQLVGLACARWRLSAELN